MGRIKAFRRFLVSSAVIALLLALFGIRNKRRDEIQTLPDGTTLKIIQMDYGKASDLRGGNWFQKTFWRYIPQRGIHLPGININPPSRLLGHESALASLVVWVEWSGQPKPIEWNDTNLHDRWRAVVIDKRGREFWGGLDSPFAKFSPIVEGCGVFYMTFSAFPRGDDAIQIALQKAVTTKEWVTYASFKVPNPVRRKDELRASVPVPTPSKTGPVKVSLNKLETIMGTSENSPRARAVFEISDESRPSGEWRIEDLSIQEGNGNFIGPMINFIGTTCELSPRGTAIVTCLSEAFPDDEQWWITAHFRRTSGFPTNDLFALSDLPAPWVLTNLERIKTNVFGKAIEIEYGPTKSFDIVPAGPETNYGNFGYIAGGTREMLFKLASAADDEGRKITLAAGPWWDNSFSLKPPDGSSKCVTFTVAVARSVAFNCVATPRPARPGG